MTCSFRKKRVSDPILGILRSVALALRESEMLGKELIASKIVEICEDNEIEIPGNADGNQKAKAKQLGIKLGKLYRQEGTQVLEIDEFSIHRTFGKDHEGRDQKSYRFEISDPLITDFPATSANPETPNDN